MKPSFNNKFLSTTEARNRTPMAVKATRTRQPPSTRPACPTNSRWLNSPIKTFTLANNNNNSSSIPLTSPKPSKLPKHKMRISSTHAGLMFKSTMTKSFKWRGAWLVRRGATWRGLLRFAAKALVMTSSKKWSSWGWGARAQASRRALAKKSRTNPSTCASAQSTSTSTRLHATMCRS